MSRLRVEKTKILIENDPAVFTIDTNEWKVIVGEHSYLFNDAKNINIQQDDHFIKISYQGIQEGLSLIVTLKENNDRIDLLLEAKEDEFIFDEMIFPGTVQNTEGKLVLPYQQGTLLDTKDNITFIPPFGGYFGCSDAYVNALGFYSDLGSYMWFVDDYYDCGYKVVRPLQTFLSSVQLAFLLQMDVYD